jgi:hypothetical protein
MALSKDAAATYASLVTVAIVEALDQFRKEAAVPPEAHPILASNIWAYVPIVLLSLVALIWLWRLLRPNPTPTDHTKSLTPVYSTTFDGQTITLDGKIFHDCSSIM